MVAGFLGLPAPNGLVPQAPDNTESLSIREQLKKKDSVGEQEVRTTRVVEQRLSHLAMGLLVLGTMSRPLLVALWVKLHFGSAVIDSSSHRGTMPRAVFAGIFLVVGWGSIEGNTITQYTLYILRDPTMIPDSHPLKRVKKMRVFRFVIVQWFVFAVAYALSHTIGELTSFSGSDIQLICCISQLLLDCKLIRSVAKNTYP